ncbi:MAG: hypothetical protein ACRCYQ_06305 [Nocardioides sp.]
MITTEEITAWFTGRLPAEWTTTVPRITVDREEITVILTVSPADLAADATPEAVQEAAAGRLSAWREETRQTRMAIAAEGQRRFERTVSWGAIVGDREALFTHLSVPVMTRLRQPQREVLDTLVSSGVARSRSDALAWCVRLVGQHTEDWLGQLRAAMEQVADVRDRGPAAS